MPPSAVGPDADRAPFALRRTAAVSGLDDPPCTLPTSSSRWPPAASACRHSELTYTVVSICTDRYLLVF